MCRYSGKFRYIRTFYAVLFMALHACHASDSSVNSSSKQILPVHAYSLGNDFVTLYLPGDSPPVVEHKEKRDDGSPNYVSFTRGEQYYLGIIYGDKAPSLPMYEEYWGKEFEEFIREKHEGDELEALQDIIESLPKDNDYLMSKIMYNPEKIQDDEYRERFRKLSAMWVMMPEYTDNYTRGELQGPSDLTIIWINYDLGLDKEHEMRFYAFHGTAVCLDASVKYGPIDGIELEPSELVQLLFFGHGREGVRNHR